MSAPHHEFSAHPAVAPLARLCRFPDVDVVRCAVSGGADSMALLVLALARGVPVEAHHVNHHLRPDADGDVAIIRRFADAHGVTVVEHHVNVPAGANLEARARTARYEVLPPDALTGHTADDMAETMLINLMRGAGTAGLSSMQPERRPLLALRRSDTRSLCSVLGIDVVTDAMNEDPRFQRTRVRHELVPLLNDIAKRDVVPILVRQSDVMGDDDRLLDELASTIDPTDARSVRDAPLPLARRALRSWLANPYPPDVATIERVLAVARGEATACDVGSGRSVRRSQQRLTIVASQGLNPGSDAKNVV
jgi:tRNA(Ile)-lysidine synthase